MKRFKRVLLFGCAVIPPLRLKSICVRTHRVKSAHLPAEYIPPTFSTRYPLPLFRRLTVGAAIEKNFFWFLFSWFSLVISWMDFYLWIIFYFSRSYFTRILNRIVYSSIFILPLDKFCSKFIVVLILNIIS